MKKNCGLLRFRAAQFGFESLGLFRAFWLPGALSQIGPGPPRGRSGGGATAIRDELFREEVFAVCQRDRERDGRIFEFPAGGDYSQRYQSSVAIGPLGPEHILVGRVPT